MKSKTSTIFMITHKFDYSSSRTCTRAGAASSWPGFSVFEENAYLSYGSQTFAVDLKNGSQIWRYPSRSGSWRQIYAAPEIGDGFAVVGDYNGVLTALDQVNGTRKWEFEGAKDRYIGSALISDGNGVMPPIQIIIYMH